MLLRPGRGEGSYYDVDGLLAGGRVLVAVAVGQVAGLDHLQCRSGPGTMF
jgi:hypothetical protein